MEIPKYIFLAISIGSLTATASVLLFVCKQHFFSSAEFRRQYGILPVPEEVQDYKRENYAENVVRLPSRTKEQAYRTFILDYLDMETGIHPDINDYVGLRGRLMRKAKSLVDKW